MSSDTRQTKTTRTHPRQKQNFWHRPRAYPCFGSINYPIPAANRYREPNSSRIDEFEPMDLFFRARG